MVNGSVCPKGQCFLNLQEKYFHMWPLLEKVKFIIFHVSSVEVHRSFLVDNSENQSQVNETQGDSQNSQAHSSSPGE